MTFKLTVEHATNLSKMEIDSIIEHARKAILYKHPEAKVKVEIVTPKGTNPSGDDSTVTRSS